VRPAIVRTSERFQTWALCERCCEASNEAASRDLDAAAAWTRLAADIAERVRVPEGFRTRLQGYAAAHGANVVRVKGKVTEADAAFAEAERLWLAGSDPDAVLDPGQFLSLKASLRREQRRLEEALDLLEEALTVGRCRESTLVKKGLTLEVLGDYEGAAKALLEALPLVERVGDPRLLYLARFNLAVVYTHQGHYDAAAALLLSVRDAASELGDAIFLSRIQWLEGRILAGQGRPREARRLLAGVRREFQRRKMSFDVALALLEEAALLLEEGHPAEAQSLAGKAAEFFEANGVHREVQASLRLLHESAERMKATAR
jgi:tetratricopeptide (TPR) repeat protein